jgi:hypothetical protein
VVAAWLRCPVSGFSVWNGVWGLCAVVCREVCKPCVITHDLRLCSRDTHKTRRTYVSLNKTMEKNHKVNTQCSEA